MARNDIGGFFMSLGLNPDRNSFETGNKLIDSVANSFNKLIGTARNAAVVLASTALASGTVASQEIHTAQALGTTTEKLNLWKAAAKIAGADANGLVGAISKLGNVMNHLTIDGSGLEAYSEQLGKLQIGFDELEGMDPADAMKTIIERAQSQLDGTDETKLRITTIVGDILGDAGQQLFIDLQRQGISIADFLNGVGQTQFETDADKEAAADFITETRYIKEEITSLTKLFGDNIARELTPYVKELKEWLLEHGPDIAEFLRVLSTNVGKLVEKLVGAGQAVAPAAKKTAAVVKDSVVQTAKGTAEMVTGVATGDASKVVEGAKKAAAGTVAPVVTAIKAANESAWAEKTRNAFEAQQAIQEYKKTKGYTGLKALKNIPYDELTPDLQKDFDKYAKDKLLGHLYFGGAVKDGIIRPDGQVTQVAPDDWVFAARNVGDLARAFIPQSSTQIQAPSQYSIVQNFTINGGSDMPQLIRAQAYKGTQDGLMALMEQSSRRLELMSGTR